MKTKINPSGITPTMDDSLKVAVEAKYRDDGDDYMETKMDDQSSGRDGELTSLLNTEVNRITANKAYTGESSSISDEPEENESEEPDKM